MCGGVGVLVVAAVAVGAGAVLRLFDDAELERLVSAARKIVWSLEQKFLEQKLWEQKLLKQKLL